MPELPELEVIAANIGGLFSGQKFAEATYLKKTRLNVTPRALAAALVGATLTSVERAGKEVLFRLDNGRVVSIHLRLKGAFELTSTPSETKFKVLQLKLERPEYLVVTDPRGWAVVTLDPKGADVPDALSSEFTVDYLQVQLAARRRKTIKAVLIDQDVVAGIGNAYADEILWRSRISPESTGSCLPKEKIQELLAATRTVLGEAIEAVRIVIGTEVFGEPRDHLVIHNPAKERSPSGGLIVRKKIASKDTYFTDEQVLYSE